MTLRQKSLRYVAIFFDIMQRFIFYSYIINTKRAFQHFDFAQDFLLKININVICGKRF